jgi:hypothetical protein
MHTKDRLAKALHEIGLGNLALRAAAGEFDDFLSQHMNPQMVLAAELAQRGSPEAMTLRAALINGDYDATEEESEAWALSDEGQEAFARLRDGK